MCSFCCHRHLVLGCLILGLAPRLLAEQTCEEGREDASVLLQSGPPNVNRASVLESKNGDASSKLDSAAAKLSDILTGRTSKSEVEIVLARYKEDISWSDPYFNIRTVYCKGPVQTALPGCIPLKNVGREGHTYLHHIVENYDRLAKWTVFTQAQAPTHGYRGHRLGGGHAIPGIPFDDYVLPETAGGLPRDDGSVFVITGAVHMPTLNHSLRLSFIGASSSPTLHAQSKCPKPELLDGWQKWWNLGWFKRFIGKRCKVAGKDLPKHFNEYWDRYVQLPRPANDILFFSQGARFAASRERIRQRPKEFYQALLDKLSSSEDPCHNYYNEWIWFYIIGRPEGSPCDSKLVVDEASTRDKDKNWLILNKIYKEKFMGRS